MLKVERLIPNETAGLIGDGLIRIDALGDVLRMTPQAIRVDLCRKTFPIPPVRIGSRLRWRVSDVRRFLADIGGGDGGAVR